MIKTSVTLSIFLSLSITTQLAAAAAIPNTIQASSHPESTSTTSLVSLTLLASRTFGHVLVTQGVAQQQPQTGNNYAVDPFGLLGSTEGQGNAGGDNQQGKQTSADKATETKPASTSKPASNAASSTATSNHASESKTISSTGSISDTGGAPGSSTQPTSSMSVTSASNAYPGAAPTRAHEGSSSDPSSGSNMNAWKVIGIGVLAFAGVVILVLGTAFQDKIFRAICRPFRRQKDDDVVLVPDWRRGSWRFGDDGFSIEKPTSKELEDEVPRIGEGEKNRLALPLPPISPFPLRRTPSTTSGPSVEPGIAGVGVGTAPISRLQSNDYDNSRSPPGLRSPRVSRKKARRSSTVSAGPLEPSESDAYGGME